MLKPAQLYKEELEKFFLRTWYDPKYMFYSGWTGNELLTIPDNNYDEHHFASIDSGGNVIGYISYRISWITMSANNFRIISIGNSVEFAKDVYQAICNLFEKHNMNRVSWCAFVENPAIKGYRNFIKKHGGRECAYHRQVAKLLDGKLHDNVEFEILASEFKK